MTKRVIYARFHENLYLPGVGNIGNVLPSQSKTFKSFHMASEAEGILIEIDGRYSTVPWPNVVIAELAPPEKPTALKSAKASGEAA